MAQIWTDPDYAMSNIIISNTYQALRFRWYFVTFSGEAQETAQVRWRKSGAGITTIYDRMTVPESAWSTPVTVGRLEDTTTWTLQDIDPGAGVNMQYVAPAAGSRRYSNITSIDFPVGYFSNGVWFFQVRFKAVGETEWSGWATHNIEISSSYGYQDYEGSGAAAVVGPNFPNEGAYTFKVEVMSEAGVTTESSDSAAFNVWETNKYLNNGTNVVAVPENIHDGTQVERARRTLVV